MACCVRMWDSSRVDDRAIATDDDGQALLGLREIGESEAAPETENPCHLALVVPVRADGRVLFGLNPWRCNWELPGGMIEHGESQREAAARELVEETGLTGVQLQWIGSAVFGLRHPDRTERAAVYRAAVDRNTEVTVTDELVELDWVDLGRPPTDVSPLDLAVARWAAAS